MALQSKDKDSKDTEYSPEHLFRALIHFCMATAKRHSFNNYNFPNVVLKETFDYLFDKSIVIPGLSRESVNNYFSEMNYMAKPLLFLGYSSYEEMGLVEKEYNKLYTDLKYCNRNNLSIHLAIQHFLENDFNWDETTEAFEYMESKYEKNKEFLHKSYYSATFVEYQQGTLREKIRSYEPIFRGSGEDLNRFYKWAFKFVTNNYPVFWTMRYLIDNYEEMVMVNNLSGPTKNVGDHVHVTGKIIGFREPSSTKNTGLESFLVEILSREKELYSFHLKCKNLQDKFKFAKHVYLGMDGIRLSGKVRKIIDKHWIWSVPSYSLNYVRTHMFP